MACEGATNRICGGLLTGEICTAPKPITGNIPPLENIIVQGTITSLQLSWDTFTSYPDHVVRGMVRPFGGSYKAEDIQFIPRDNGTIIFTNLEVDTKYHILVRVEDADEANEFHHASGYPREVDPIFFTQVIHRLDSVWHQGDAVLYTT